MHRRIGDETQAIMNDVPGPTAPSSAAQAHDSATSSFQAAADVAKQAQHRWMAVSIAIVAATLVSAIALDVHRGKLRWGA
jgi:hypothetical protein